MASNGAMIQVQISSNMYICNHLYIHIYIYIYCCWILQLAIHTYSNHIDRYIKVMRNSCTSQWPPKNSPQTKSIQYSYGCSHLMVICGVLFWITSTWLNWIATIWPQERPSKAMDGPGSQKVAKLCVLVASGSWLILKSVNIYVTHICVKVRYRISDTYSLDLRYVHVMSKHQFFRVWVNQYNYST